MAAEMAPSLPSTTAEPALGARWGRPGQGEGLSLICSERTARDHSACDEVLVADSQRIGSSLTPPTAPHRGNLPSSAVFRGGRPGDINEYWPTMAS
jgi:hypothetical protein